MTQRAYLIPFATSFGFPGLVVLGLAEGGIFVLANLNYRRRNKLLNPSISDDNPKIKLFRTNVHEKIYNLVNH